jgi:hypothetical protein
VDFLDWGDGEVRSVVISFPQKIPNKDATYQRKREIKIPLLYVQLIDQLQKEVHHSEHNNGHEALRRGSYAMEILQHLGKELKLYNGAEEDFRSKVLNPILQRYLRGIPDAYTPAVEAAIGQASADALEVVKTENDTDDSEDDPENNPNKPTILGATVFYLSVDPVDTKNIPLYRRNLIYIAESRWHLNVLRGEELLEDVEFFNTCRIDHHDYVMEAYQNQLEDHEGNSQDNGNLLFNEAEVEVILAERLEEFFNKELEELVSKRKSSSLIHCH